MCLLGFLCDFARVCLCVCVCLSVCALDFLSVDLWECLCANMFNCVFVGYCV